jgi:hypothetical protein
MKPALVLALLASLVGAGGYAYAQSAGPQPPPDAAQARPEPRPEPRAERFGRAELESLADARVAAIQGGLRLTPEQRTLWPPVEQAVRAMAAERIERLENRREARAGGRDRPGDFMERVDRRTERAVAQAQRLAALQGALKPLWVTLDERQKRVLPVLMRDGGGMRMAGRMHHRHHGGGHHGPDRDGPGPR